MPASFSKLQHLDEANFGGNKLKTLPKANNWGSVSRLSLMWNTVVMLPSLAPMSNLVQLQLNRNMLRSLPELGELGELELLDISSNDIEELPTSIQHMQKLKQLNTRENKLTTLPAEIGMLLQLETLNIGKNALTTIPDELGACASLKVLLADINPALVAIPDSMKQLTHLERVSLEKTGVPATADVCRSLAGIVQDNGGWIMH